MGNINPNLSNSNDNIDFSNIFNSMNEKDNLINYNGENISILSKSFSEINSPNEKNSNLQNELKTPKKLLTYENKYYKNSITNNRENSNSKNLTQFDSDSTSNTYKKNLNNISINKINSNITSAIKSEINNNYDSELINFFWEMNLPFSYVSKFIENGFDNLNVLIEMTKTGIDVNNETLKEIGILNAADRTKILINLEEMAGVIPIDIEKSIIYNNDSNCDSLNTFLKDCKCQKYINNFNSKGYYNIELLFSQMLTREPVNINMLKEDFCIKNEWDINKIMKGLEDGSKNYLKKLRKTDNNYNSNIYST